MSKIIYPASHWGSNIGNAFFNIGTIYILNKAIPGADIVMADLPPMKAFGLTEKQEKNDAKYGFKLGLQDYLVLDGPMFDENFDKLFGPYLKRAKELGVKVILMSSGGISYTESEIAHCRGVLMKYKPFMITTRDRETFDNYGDLAEHSYNAICSAWFVPEAYPGYEVPDEADYISVCFDHAPEPRLEINRSNLERGFYSEAISISPVKHSFKTKITRLFQRGLKEKINGYDVIRPNHQVLNRQNWRLFFKPGTFVSQTPYGYLNIYRNTKLTVTDRLHACVATLAYGNPARLFIKSKRVLLLDRVGARDVCSKVYKIDMEYLNSEKAAYIDWMKSVFAEKN